eukprot:gene3698-4218_t
MVSDQDILLLPERNDDESSEFGSEDEEFDESCRLVRVLAQHRRVTGVIEHKIWLVKDLLHVKSNMSLRELHDILRQEQEKERNRRISAPYSASIDITDVEWVERSQNLVNVHEQLLRLFSIHQAIYLERCEQLSRIEEAKRQSMHEELVRKAARREVDKAVEEERRRRSGMFDEMSQGRGDMIHEMAETHEKLSAVHEELTESFQHVWKVFAAREAKQRMEEEFLEEQEREGDARRLSAQLEDAEQLRRIRECSFGREDLKNFRARINDCHTELQQRNATDEESEYAISNFETELSREEYLRHLNIEKAKLLMVSEQNRRKTTRLSDEELAEKMEIVEKLFLIHEEIKQKYGN